MIIDCWRWWWWTRKWVGGTLLGGLLNQSHRSPMTKPINQHYHSLPPSHTTQKYFDQKISSIARLASDQNRIRITWNLLEKQICIVIIVILLKLVNFQQKDWQRKAECLKYLLLESRTTRFNQYVGHKTLIRLINKSNNKVLWSDIGLLNKSALCALLEPNWFTASFFDCQTCSFSLQYIVEKYFHNWLFASLNHWWTQGTPPITKKCIFFAVAALGGGGGTQPKVHCTFWNIKHSKNKKVLWENLGGGWVSGLIQPTVSKT